MRVLDFTKKETEKNESVKEGSRFMVDKIDTIMAAKVIIGEESDPNNLNYSWDIVSMDKRKLELQIDFESPLYISTEDEPEYLEVQMLNVYQFVSE